MSSESRSEALVQLRMALEPVWGAVREIRARVLEALRACPGYSPELRESAGMAASELVENAIRYGDSPPSCQIVFSLLAGAEKLELRVSNGCANRSSVDRIAAGVASMQAAEDRRVPYLQRLETLMSGPQPTPKLGLYRIGFEGMFDLGYVYEDGVVTVTATRSVT